LLKLLALLVPIPPARFPATLLVLELALRFPLNRLLSPKLNAPL
jgi:hypothetical protein